MSFADHQDFLPSKEELARIGKELTKLEKGMDMEIELKALKEKELNKRIRETKERIRQESNRKISTYELGNYFMQELDALERYLRNTL